MKGATQRYFLALIPPETILSRVENVKREFELEYGSKGALRSPGHITLHMPFLWKTAKEDQLIEVLNRTPAYPAFDVQLNGFGCFEPRTIFIKNDPCPALMGFQKQLVAYTKPNLKLLNSTHNRGYYPHLTVAFRDLKKDQFYRAWEKFESREFKAKWAVGSFWLLKHNGKIWEAFREFHFG